VGDSASRRSELAATHLKIARIAEQLGADEEAMSAYQQADTILSQLPNSESDRALCANSMGLLYTRCRQYDTADRSFQNAIRFNQRLLDSTDGNHNTLEIQRRQAVTLVNQAFVRTRMQDDSQVEELLTKAETTQQRLSEAVASESPFQRELTWDRAKTCGALSLYYSDTDLAKSLVYSARTISFLQDYCEARSQDRVVGIQDSIDEARSDWMVALGNRAKLLAKLSRKHDATSIVGPHLRGGLLQDAAQTLDQALTIGKQLVAEQPTNPVPRRGLISLLTFQGLQLTTTDGSAELSSQIASLQEAYRQAIALRGLDPKSIDNRILLVNTIYNLGVAAKQHKEDSLFRDCIQRLASLRSELNDSANDVLAHIDGRIIALRDAELGKTPLCLEDNL
jgi:tetratricopeptide (TPR) repeat protein